MLRSLFSYVLTNFIPKYTYLGCSVFTK
jgi:hypothetical protein